uniref:RING-type E3 ubiquitin transferase n=1 Tax=Panagrolaimus sp. PS1159 TaxID=55785 RepID=A0AC35GS17_9BILA
MKSLIDAAKKHGNPHKLILQLVMARGGIRTSKIADVFQRICQACSLDTEITEDCTPDAIYESYFVMYATKSAAKSTKLLIFSDHEKLLFETWIEIMFVKNPVQERGEIDAKTALDACINSNIRPLQAEAFLNKLEKDHIFQKLQETDSYIFSARAVKELEPILRTSDYEVWTCLICSNLVITRRFSHQCITCGTVMHNTCLNKMIKLSNTEVSCPGHLDNGGRCTNRFGIETLELMVFEKAAPETINQQIEIVGVRGGNNTEDNAEQENAQDSAENELETTDEQREEEMTEGGEDMDEGGEEEEDGDEQMGELEEIFAEHNVEDTFASTSSNQETPVKAKKQSSAAKKSGDALDDLFAEMEEEEEDDDDNDAEE